MVKIVTFFLIGMLVLALFGRLRLPKVRRFSDVKCSKCGRFKIGKGSCPCGQV